MKAVHLTLIYFVRTDEGRRTMGQTALQMADISPQSSISASFFSFWYLIFLEAIQILFPSPLSFNNVLYKAVPTQDVTNPVRVLVLMNVQCSCLPSSHIILHLLHNRSNGSSQSLPSTTFHNGVSNELSSSRHNTKLRNKCAISLVSYLDLWVGIAQSV